MESNQSNPTSLPMDGGRYRSSTPINTSSSLRAEANCASQSAAIDNLASSSGAARNEGDAVHTPVILEQTTTSVRIQSSYRAIDSTPPLVPRGGKLVSGFNSSAASSAVVTNPSPVPGSPPGVFTSAPINSGGGPNIGGHVGLFTSAKSSTLASLQPGQSTPPTGARASNSTHARPPLYVHPSSMRDVQQPAQIQNLLNSNRRRLSNGLMTPTSSGSESNGASAFDFNEQSRSIYTQNITNQLPGNVNASSSHSSHFQNNSNFFRMPPAHVSPHLPSRSPSPSLSINSNYSPHLFNHHSPSQYSPSHHAMSLQLQEMRSFTEAQMSRNDIVSPKARKELRRLKAAIKKQKVVFATVMSLVAFCFIRIVLVPFLQSAKFEAFFTGGRGGYTERLAKEDENAYDTLLNHKGMSKRLSASQTFDSRTTVLIDSPHIVSLLSSNKNVADHHKDDFSSEELENQLEQIIEYSMRLPNIAGSVASLGIKAKEEFLNTSSSIAMRVPLDNFNSTRNHINWLAMYLSIAADAQESEVKEGRDQLNEVDISPSPSKMSSDEIVSAVNKLLMANTNESDLHRSLEPQIRAKLASVVTKRLSNGVENINESTETKSLSFGVKKCSWDSQGRSLAVDDRGYVCPLRMIFPLTGCCNGTANAESTEVQKLDNEKCKVRSLKASSEGHEDCFPLYEECVACCISSHRNSGEDTLKTFHMCRLSCRSGSSSLSGRKRVTAFAGVQLEPLLKNQTDSALLSDRLHTFPLYESGYSEVHLHYASERRHCFSGVAEMISN